MKSVFVVLVSFDLHAVISKRLGDGLFGIFAGPLQVQGNVPFQLVAPAWLLHLVEHDSQVSEVERHILDAGRDEDDWLSNGMGKPELVEDVWIFPSQVGEQNLGVLNLEPDLFHDRARREQAVRTKGFEAGILDRGRVDLLEVPVEPASKWHQHETGIEKLPDVTLRGGRCLRAADLGSAPNDDLNWPDDQWPVSGPSLASEAQPFLDEDKQPSPLVVVLTVHGRERTVERGALRLAARARVGAGEELAHHGVAHRPASLGAREHAGDDFDDVHLNQRSARMEEGMKRTKRRVWSVADLAAHAGISHGRALRLLKRLNKKHRGKLLVPSAGANREYTFLPATLARLEPDLFAPVEDLEPRVTELEETVAELRAAQKRTVLQVGNNTRAIARAWHVLMPELAKKARRAA
jgi:hypothetical protein